MLSTECGAEGEHDAESDDLVAGSVLGWGILGWNIFEHCAAGPDIQPLMGVRMQPRDLPAINPLRAMTRRNESASIEPVLSLRIPGGG